MIFQAVTQSQPQCLSVGPLRCNPTAPVPGLSQPHSHGQHTHRRPLPHASSSERCAVTKQTIPFVCCTSHLSLQPLCCLEISEGADMENGITTPLEHSDRFRIGEAETGDVWRACAPSQCSGCLNAPAASTLPGASACQLLLTGPPPVSSPCLLWVLNGPVTLLPSCLAPSSLTPRQAVKIRAQVSSSTCPRVPNLGPGVGWALGERGLSCACLCMYRPGCGCSVLGLLCGSSHYLAASSLGWNENLFAFFLFGNLCALLYVPAS